ncbi:MAG: thermonuclease family protein [Microgenomates group bacterium]
MNWKVVLAILVCIGVGVGIGKNINKEKLYTVQRVIDGDTLVVDNNQEIRLANIDAPEKGLCGFEEAKNEMEKLTLNKKIKIVGKTNDKFGRLLTTAWIDNKMLNEEMARSGWVRYVSQGDNKQISEIDNVAEKNKLGIYGKCVETTNLNNPKCLIKGNNRENEKIFVLPKCKGYTNTDIETDLGDQWFCTEAEAIAAGYKKALNCN